MIFSISLVSCRQDLRPVPDPSYRIYRMPLAINRDNGAIHVQLQVKGQTFSALLDTGFSGSLLMEKALIQELDLSRSDAKVEAQTMWGDSSGGISVYTAPELKWGDSLELADVEVWKYGGLGRAVLGLGVLTNFNILIDYQEGYIELYTRYGIVPEYIKSWPLISFELDNLIWLDVYEQDMGKGRMILDSGVVIPDRWNGYHYHTLSINSSQVRKLLTDKEINKALDLENQHPGDVNFSKANTIYLYTDDLQISGQHLGPQIFVGVPMNTMFGEGALGLGFFKERKVFIDFDQQVIYVDHLTSTIPDDKQKQHYQQTEKSRRE